MSLTLSATNALRFVERLTLLRNRPELRTPHGIALTVRSGLLGSWTPDEIRCFAEGVGLDGGLVEKALKWNWRGDKPRRTPTGHAASFVRRMIEAGEREDPSRILRRLSPVEIPDGLADQRRVFLEAIHSDWRGRHPSEMPSGLSVPVNQQTEDGCDLLNCRNAVVSFGELPLHGQLAFFAGVVREGSLPLKAVVCAHSRRFGVSRAYGVVRLAECRDRIPGRQPPGTVVREETNLADCDVYLDGWRELGRWLASDPDPRCRCDLSASDPHDRVYCPGEDRDWLVRLLWATGYDHYVENVF